MRRLTLVTTLLATAASAAVAQASQEPVYLRMGGQIGQSNRYLTTTEVFMRGPMAGSDTTQPTTRTVRHTTRTVNRVSGDTITFVDLADSVRMDSPANPQMSERMAGAAAQMHGQTVTTTMDARARILSVDVANVAAPEPAATAPADGGGMRGGMRGGNMPGRNLRAMFVLPERAVRPGDTWTDSMVVAGTGPAEGPTNFLATYRLERIEQRGSFRVAVISMNGSMANNSPNGPVTMTVTGELAYDITGRRLAQMTMTVAGNMPTPRGDLPVKMRLTHQLVS